MEKLYCMFVKEITSGQKTFYVTTLCSGYGFIQDVFISKDLYNNLAEQIDTFGFVDVTDYFHLKYDKKLDKLVYNANTLN